VTAVCRSAMSSDAQAGQQGRAWQSTAHVGAIVFIISLGAVIWPDAARSTSAPALDAATHAVVVRDTKACQSPWQVMEGRECSVLSAGTQVSVVSGDEFFACIVWSGAQRCMWVARDALRRP
jgi:hypothetical protein